MYSTFTQTDQLEKAWEAYPSCAIHLDTWFIMIHPHLGLWNPSCLPSAMQTPSWSPKFWFSLGSHMNRIGANANRVISECRKIGRIAGLRFQYSHQTEMKDYCLTSLTAKTNEHLPPERIGWTIHLWVNSLLNFWGVLNRIAMCCELLALSSRWYRLGSHGHLAAAVHTASCSQPAVLKI